MRKLAPMAIGILVVVAGLALSSPGRAQVQPPTLLYSVKFVCGLQTTSPSNPPSEPPVKPGNYATAINIHNFHDSVVQITKKAVIALSEDVLPRGLISQPRNDYLGPNQALEVDCSDIVNLFASNLPTPFIKGFVEIKACFFSTTSGCTSPTEVSVVAVYTAKECHTFSPTNPHHPVPACQKFGELSLQVVPYRQPFMK